MSRKRRKKGRKKKKKRGFLYRRKVNKKRKWGKIGAPHSAKRKRHLARIRPKKRKRRR